MITVLTGNNTHALRTKLTVIKRTFKEQYGENSIEVYSQEQLLPEKVDALLAGTSLFALNRLVVVEDISQNKAVAELLSAQLSRISEETHLVLVEPTPDKRTVFYKTLKKAADDFQEFNELDEQSAAAWVSEQVKSEGGEISSAAVRLLIRYAGTDQLRLTQELAKLLAFNKTISNSAIEELVERNPEETVFQLLDFALSGNTTEALNILESLETAHEDPFQAANMLIWQTHIVAVVASSKGASDGELAKNIKANPFVIKKAKGLTARISRQKLSRILDTVAEVDVLLKTTAVDPWRLLEQTVMRLES